MKCRYCGYDVKTVGQGLSGSYGQQCKSSPTGKHVGVSDGTNCVYCGRPAKPQGNQLATCYGTRCTASPTGGHALQ